MTIEADPVIEPDGPPVQTRKAINRGIRLRANKVNLPHNMIDDLIDREVSVEEANEEILSWMES